MRSLSRLVLSTLLDWCPGKRDTFERKLGCPRSGSRTHVEDGVYLKPELDVDPGGVKSGPFMYLKACDVYECRARISRGSVPSYVRPGVKRGAVERKACE